MIAFKPHYLVGCVVLWLIRCIGIDVFFSKDQVTKSLACFFILRLIYPCEQSKEDGKDQEIIQSSTTTDPGYHMGK